MLLPEPDVINRNTRAFHEATRLEILEIKDLNGRLGQYISRVRLLEDQNRRYVGQLQQLSNSWAQKNRDNRSRLSVDISVSRKKFAETNRAKFIGDVRAKRLRYKINEYKKRIHELSRLRDEDLAGLAGYDKAVKEQHQVLYSVQERLTRALQEEIAVYNSNQTLHAEIDRVFDQIDNIVIDKLDFQSQASRIELEINLLKRIHDTEVVELSKMVVLAPADTKEFFKTEIALAIRDIRKEFEHIHKITVQNTRTVYEERMAKYPVVASYAHKKQEAIESCRIKTDQLNASSAGLKALNEKLEQEYRALLVQRDEEAKRQESSVKSRQQQLDYIRSEYSKLCSEYQTLVAYTSVKNSEILIYRALVEGEEKRVGVRHDYVHAPQPQLTHVTHVHKEQDINASGSNNIKFNTQAHGNIALLCDPVGRSITLENKSNLTENVSNWRLTRKVDDDPEIVYTIPAGVTIGGRTRLKIYPGGHARDSGSLVNHSITKWGMGAYVLTTLYNEYGTLRARHEQNAAVEDI